MPSVCSRPGARQTFLTLSYSMDRFPINIFWGCGVSQMIVVPEGKEEVSPSSSVCPCSMLSDLLWVLENEVLTSWRSRNTTTQN